MITWSALLRNKGMAWLRLIVLDHNPINILGYLIQIIYMVKHSYATKVRRYRYFTSTSFGAFQVFIFFVASYESTTSPLLVMNLKVIRSALASTSMAP